MRAFITGVSGFVGPYLAAHLKESGFEVFGIDRSGKKVAGCSVFECNVLERDKLFGIVKGVKPDFVFHLAAQSSVDRSFDFPEETRQINVDGTRNLLDAVIAAGASPHILIVSSAQIYGNPRVFPISEDSPLSPVSPYAESRVEQENLCHDYFRNGKLKIVISRSFNHTGPGQQPGFVCSSLAKQVAEIEKGSAEVINVGNLDAERDFTDVRDMVVAYRLAATKCVPGETYNICTGKSYSVKSILGILKSFSSAKVKVVVDKSRLRSADVDIIVGDNSKFVRATGWKPSIPFRQTLKDLLDYWRRQH